MMKFGRVVLALLIVAFLLHTDRLDLAAFGRLQPTSVWFVLACACMAAAIGLPILRWWMLLRAQEMAARPGEVLQLSMIGYFFNTFVPGGAGGDLAKAYYVCKGREGRRARAVGTILVDRFIGLHAILIMGSVAWAVQPSLARQHPGLGPWLAAMAVLAVGATLAAALCLVPSVRGWLLRLFRLHDRVELGFHRYGRHLPLILGTYCISFVSNAANLLVLWCFLRVLRDQVDVLHTLTIGPLIIVANCLPLTPGGIGVAEGVSDVLFRALGSAQGAEAMLSMRVLTYLFCLVGLPFWLAFRGRVEPAEQEPA